MFNILEVSCEATKQCSCLIMPALSLIKQFINIVKIAIPIILIVMGMIDLAKAMMSADDGAMKKAQGSFVKKLIAGVCVFLVPTILNLVLSVVATGTKGEVETGNWATCWDEAEELAKCCNNGGTSNNGGPNNGGSNVDDIPSACYLCSNSSGMYYTWSKNVSGSCALQSDITNQEDCNKKNDTIEHKKKASISCPNGTLSYGQSNYARFFSIDNPYSLCYYDKSYDAFNVDENSSCGTYLNDSSCAAYPNSKVMFLQEGTRCNYICYTQRVASCDDGSEPVLINSVYYCN